MEKVGVGPAVRISKGNASQEVLIMIKTDNMEQGFCLSTINCFFSKIYKRIKFEINNTLNCQIEQSYNT